MNRPTILICRIFCCLSHLHTLWASLISMIFYFLSMFSLPKWVAWILLLQCCYVAHSYNQFALVAASYLQLPVTLLRTINGFINFTVILLQWASGFYDTACCIWPTGFWFYQLLPWLFLHLLESMVFIFKHNEDKFWKCDHAVILLLILTSLTAILSGLALHSSPHIPLITSTAMSTSVVCDLPFLGAAYRGDYLWFLLGSTISICLITLDSPSL